jgi:hypothetical protein
MQVAAFLIGVVAGGALVMFLYELHWVPQSNDAWGREVERVRSRLQERLDRALNREADITRDAYELRRQLDAMRRNNTRDPKGRFAKVN